MWRSLWLYHKAIGKSRIIRMRHLPLSFPQPPEQQKQWDQRERKKKRPTAPVNDAVDHLRSDVNAKQPDHHDPKAIAQNSQREDEQHQHRSSPRAAEEQIRGQYAGDEKNPARPDSAALLRHAERDI